MATKKEITKQLDVFVKTVLAQNNCEGFVGTFHALKDGKVSHSIEISAGFKHGDFPSVLKTVSVALERNASQGDTKK